MPCRCDGFEDYASASRMALQKRYDEAMGLLCDVCKTMEESGTMPSAGPLRVWWERHKREDAERQRRADVAQRALREVARSNLRKQLQDAEAAARTARAKLKELEEGD